jgi:phosphatidylglycerophosphate synthase
VIARGQRWKLHIVTAVSSTRLIGAPIFVFLFVSPSRREHAASLPLLLLLFMTDIIDGFLARRWSVTTNFGYVLDGVADRSAHIGVVVALAARSELSAVLAFVLIFRDVLLYAARSLFETWWAANAAFRRRVKIAAVLFKITVGSIALMSYMTTVAPGVLSPIQRFATLAFLKAATWLFAAWSYALLAQQVHKYASLAQPADRAGEDPK